jgi:hypothetical protein
MFIGHLQGDQMSEKDAQNFAKPFFVNNNT